MADFNPDDLSEISARFERAEKEESTTICVYIELPYETAAHLIQQYNAYQSGDDWQALFEMVKFMEPFAETLATALEEAGLPPA